MVLSPACRFCGAPLEITVADLGRTPLANSYVRPEEAAGVDPVYPLHARLCTSCGLVQVDDVVPPEAIFSDYAYFSSYSDSWVEHARRFADLARTRLGLDAGSLVLEIASNDGYLLQHFRAAGVPVLGVEPAANVADVAIARGIPTEVTFFGTGSARRLDARADLVVANNVLAHVPDLNDFVEGLNAVLAPQGVVTVEVPHLLRMIAGTQFDTIYHEHFSYFSLRTIAKVLAAHDLEIFDVEELASHGGSLRIWAGRSGAREPEASVQEVLQREQAAGLDGVEVFRDFQQRVERCRDGLVEFLGARRDDGAIVVGYGAAAKGNTLLNYCGVGAKDLAYVADLSPHKQGTLLPGSRIPVVAPEQLRATRPAVVLVLPWNLQSEIMRQLRFIEEWGGRFVVAVPELRIVS